MKKIYKFLKLYTNYITWRNNYMDEKNIQICQMIYKSYNLSIVENSQNILKKKMNEIV